MRFRTGAVCMLAAGLAAGAMAVFPRKEPLLSKVWKTPAVQAIRPKHEMQIGYRVAYSETDGEGREGEVKIQIPGLQNGESYRLPEPKWLTPELSLVAVSLNQNGIPQFNLRSNGILHLPESPGQGALPWVPLTDLPTIKNGEMQELRDGPGTRVWMETADAPKVYASRMRFTTCHMQGQTAFDATDLGKLMAGDWFEFGIHENAKYRIGITDVSPDWINITVTIPSDIHGSKPIGSRFRDAVRRKTIEPLLRDICSWYRAGFSDWVRGMPVGVDYHTLDAETSAAMREIEVELSWRWHYSSDNP